MTRILNRYIFGNEESEQVVKDWHVLQEKGFNQYVVEKVSPFIGMTQNELKAHFKVDSETKNINELLLARMLDVRGKIAYTEEFQKAGIVPKTIRVQKDGTVRESMSFPAFDFVRLSKESEWEESELYNYLAPTKFLFVIFQENERGNLIFEKVMFWDIPAQDLDEVRPVWERTVEALRRGVRLIKSSRGIINEFPKQSESPVAHVRPHGRNASDKLPLPDGRMMPK